MKIFRTIEEVENNSNTILTVGTFDGLHLGHQKLLEKLIYLAKKDGLRSMVITLDPHPQIVLKKSGKEPIKLLTTINERLLLFEKFGLDSVTILPFTEEFSKLQPEDFVRDYLYSKIGLKKLLIGYDHLFGKDRRGDAKLLDALSKELNFDVLTIEALQKEDVVVSSTKIRKALIEGKIELANSMLNYTYFVLGTVVKGDGRGRKIGYPTANIIPENSYKLLPCRGVYLVSSIIEDKKYWGMANIGYRPTFTNSNELILEVHFFNFNQDIYYKKIKVEFYSFIREEKKFDSLENFLYQLKLDKQNCEEKLKMFL